MFCTCGDVQRLLSHHSVLRYIAHRALAAAPISHLHQASTRLATWGHLSKGLKGTKCISSDSRKFRTYCMMSEVAHAPPQAENGAAESDMDALRKQIAELQVRWITYLRMDLRIAAIFGTRLPWDGWLQLALSTQRHMHRNKGLIWLSTCNSEPVA